MIPPAVLVETESLSRLSQPAAGRQPAIGTRLLLL